MAIDTEKLQTILTAAQNPNFKKFLDERTRKLEERTKLDAEISALDEKISSAIPPELLALLAPAAAKARKSKAPSPEAPTPETAAKAPAAMPAATTPEIKAEPAPILAAV